MVMRSGLEDLELTRRRLFGVLCNVPFLLLGLPTPLILPSWLFAPVISICLFILPGFSWSKVLEKEKSIDLFFKIFARSICVMVGIVVIHRLVGLPPSRLSWLLMSVLVVNLGLLRKATSRNLELLWQRYRKNHVRWISFGFACALLYSILTVCAFRLIPPMLDHDWDSQSNAYGFIHTLTPLTVTDRGVLYYLADPPLLGFQIGLVALAKGSLNELAYHYKMAEALKATQGIFPLESAWHVAADQSRHRFLADPHLLETRIPTLFFATATLPILFGLLQRLTQSSTLSAIGCLLYFTFPQILVQSSNGGYTAMAIFFLLIIANGYLQSHRQTILWGSFFAAIAKNPQTVVLPLAIALWAGLRETRGSVLVRLRAMAVHPTLVGFFMGMVCFFVYGLVVSPPAFWQDYIRGHFLNRLLHIDTGGVYPSVGSLWRQFNQVQGFPFLPLAIFCVAWMLVQTWRQHSPQGAIPLWVILGAILFSIIDWRQTKHLTYIVPALVMATMGFIAHQRGKLRWSFLGLVGFVIFYNIWRIAGSGGDLLALHPTGDW